MAKYAWQVIKRGVADIKFSGNTGRVIVNDGEDISSGDHIPILYRHPPPLPSPSPLNYHYMPFHF